MTGFFETFPTLSDDTYDVGNMKCDKYIKEDEVVVNEKTEMVIGSEEGKCVDIKDEEGLHIDEDEENMDIKTEEDSN